MTTTDKVLVVLLRVMGVGSLLALVPVVMPYSWMLETHRWLGLGEMPTSAIVEYLARNLSAFYALVGAFCLVVASDLNRYRPMVGFFGLALAIMSLIFFAVDLSVGMPWWWTAFEGPPGIPFGLFMAFLALDHSKPETP
jgi:hypothetical protein